MRYGVSLAEPVCTENLTPWLKLLPSARQKDGITSLLNPLKIYDGAFHSMSLHYKSSNSSSTSRSTRGQVEQVYSEATLTLSLTFVNYHKLKGISFSCSPLICVQLKPLYFLDFSFFICLQHGVFRIYLGASRSLLLLLLERQLSWSTRMCMVAKVLQFILM